jgi:predicted ATP-grasp superfamily ATP-dependent carboligase
MKRIFIYEANSLQALAVSKFIQKNSNFIVVGGVEENIRFNKKNYDEIIIDKFENIDIDKYDYVLPMGAQSSFEIVTKFKSLKYENGINFLKNNLLVFDKPKMLIVAKNVGIPIPVTYFKKEDILVFPIFYKEDFENGGGIRGVAKNRKEIPLSKNLIFQEYISTPSTYGVGFLAKKGKILTYTIHKEVISFPVDGGSSVVIEEFKDKRLLEYTEKIVYELNYSGWGLAEYKYCDKRKDFVFMEINGKFWASIEFMLYNNPGFLKYLLNIDYPVKKVKKVLFINRLFQYSFIDILKNIKYIFDSKIVKESCLLYQIMRKIIPNSFVLLLKGIIK